MEWLRKNSRKTLLGQLLIEENLLSESQLARAIEQQKKTGQRLGDVVAELDLISKKQVAAVLRKQRTLRFMASIVTVLLGPIPVAATAATPVAPAMTQTQKAAPQHTRKALTETLHQSKATQRSLNQDPWGKVLSEHGVHKTELHLTPHPQEENAIEGREEALLTVAQHHSRVANTIRNLWGHRECNEYINKLLMDGNDHQGRARVGFHHDAVEAMMKLITLHEQQFPEFTVANTGLGRFPFAEVISV